MQRSIFGLIERQFLETAKTSCGDSPVLRRTSKCPHPPALNDLAKIQVTVGGYSSVEKHVAL